MGQIQFTVTTDLDNQVFEANAAGDAESNNTTTITRVSTLGPTADLQVANLHIDPVPGLQSGAMATVVWDDANTGPRADSRLVDRFDRGYQFDHGPGPRQRFLAL